MDCGGAVVGVHYYECSVGGCQIDSLFVCLVAVFMLAHPFFYFVDVVGLEPSAVVSPHHTLETTY